MALSSSQPSGTYTLKLDTQTLNQESQALPKRGRHHLAWFLCLPRPCLRCCRTTMATAAAAERHTSPPIMPARRLVPAKKLRLRRWCSWAVCCCSVGGRSGCDCCRGADDMPGKCGWVNTPKVMPASVPVASTPSICCLCCLVPVLPPQPASSDTGSILQTMGHPKGEA